MNKSETVRRAGIHVVLLLAWTACGGAGTGLADLDAEERAIGDISSRWLAHARDRHADSIAVLFAPDGIALEAGSPAVQGIEAIRADIAGDWASNPDFTIDWRSTAVTVAASGDMAWEWGRWTFDPDGPGMAPPAHGEYVTVYEKVDGDWKIAADIGVPTESATGGESLDQDRVEP